MAPGSCEYDQVFECEYSEQLNLFQNCGEVGLSVINEIHAQVKIIESHALILCQLFLKCITSTLSQSQQYRMIYAVIPI